MVNLPAGRQPLSRSVKVSQYLIQMPDLTHNMFHDGILCGNEEGPAASLLPIQGLSRTRPPDDPGVPRHTS